jgi:hypothetical protein
VGASLHKLHGLPVYLPPLIPGKQIKYGNISTKLLFDEIHTIAKQPEYLF